jgi:probable F420-dependent oxidoreductase
VDRPFRFAVQTGPFDRPDALRDHARRVEDLGYDELFSADHLGMVDPFLPLVVAAEATTTLRFGPLVINNEFHHTALLARSAATFDALTGGRLVLGIGTGYQRSEHDAASIDLRPAGDRVTRLEESLAAVRTLLDDGAATVDGSFVRLAIEDLGVRPTQTHVPLLVGGHGRRVVGVAARHADIFQFTGLTHDPATGAPGPGGFGWATVAERARWLTEAAGDRDVERSVLVQVTHLGHDADAARRAVADRMGVGVELVADTPFVLIGTTDEVVDRLERMRDEVGVSHVVVRDAAGFAPVVAALSGR